MRLKKKLAIAALIAAPLALVAGEVIARYALGLGDPPLIMRHKTVDYLYVPGEYRRFGNRIFYNSHSMRAPDAPPRKSDPQEFRVLVMGDSVINGGALTDNANLATRLAQRRLEAALERPVWIGNASAGSWGPANLLAYARHFGWFDADILIFVMSAHDVDDLPQYKPDLGPNFPEQTPAFALVEAFERYLPRYLPAWFPGQGASGGSEDDEEDPMEASAPPVSQAGLTALRSLLAEASSNLPFVTVLYHPTRVELNGPPSAGATPAKTHKQREALWREAEAADVQILSTAPYLEATADIDGIYRDNIHVTPLGQEAYANAIVCIVESRLQGLSQDRCASPPTED